MALIAFLEYNKPKVIDWSPTYSIRDKIPFGLYVLNEEMPSLLGKNKITKFSKTIYEFLNDSSIDKTSKKTILIIGDDSNVDRNDIRHILDFVEKGNTFFVISKNLPWILKDTLNIQISYGTEEAEKKIVWTSNNNISTYKFDLNKAFVNYYFKEIDTQKTTVLGFQDTKEDGIKPNFIKVPFGKGFFYFNTQPNAFTNYSLLESNNHLYVENVLSYIDNSDVYWNVSLVDGEEIESDSIMRFILKNPSLKWSWYFFLIGTLTFCIFTAKRKQRIITEKEPLKNTTVEFTKTISNLYLSSNDYPNLMDKIILYSLEKIRRIYLIDTHKLDDAFINKLHKMTNKDLEKIQEFVQLINKHKKFPKSSTQESVIALNSLTEEILN